MKINMLEDLNYQASIEELYPGELSARIGKASISSLPLKIVKLAIHVLLQFFSFKKKEMQKNIDVVVVLFTINQLRALNDLIKSIPNVLVISTFPVECENNLVVNTRGNNLVSFIELPSLLFNMFKKKGFKYKSMIYHFDDYLSTPGLYSTARKQLRKIQPKMLLVANDHMFFTRSYFRAAQKEGIKTVYTQHASVSAFFPDLEFDYAFLDGEETLYKYTGNEKKYSSDIFLSGSPRFDKIVLIPEINNFELGIAINAIDNRDKVLNFIKILMLNNIKFIFRPHPGQPDIDFWKQYCEVNNIAYSNPFKDSAIDFIASCKRFAVGDSALHLEVVLCGKISYYINFQDEISDSYHYIKDGLIDVKSEEQIVSALKDKEAYSIPIDKVKYYVANFGTDYWGKSTELIAKTILEINSGTNLLQWKLKGFESKIFEINNDDKKNIQ